MLNKPKYNNLAKVNCLVVLLSEIRRVSFKLFIGRVRPMRPKGITPSVTVTKFL